MKPTIIYIVRHGQSEHNLHGLNSGHVNPSLTPKGRQQAVATRNQLSGIYFDDVYSSDLERAIDTAELIYGKPVPKAHQMHQLRERDFGTYDGKPQKDYDELKKRNKPHYDTLTPEEKWRYKNHEGIESNHELASRFMKGLVHIAENNSQKTILVAAHGGTLRTALIDLGYATEDELPSGSIENAGYAELIYQDGEFTIGAVKGANKQTTA